MVQYFVGSDCVMIEDTDLISKKEAYSLFNKYEDDIIKKIKNGDEFHFCIWENCEKIGDYDKIELELDSRDDIFIKGNIIYERVTKVLANLKGYETKKVGLNIN